MRHYLLSISCLLLYGLAACNRPSKEMRQFIKVNAERVALTHVRVIDGTGSPAREDQTILLANGKIVAIRDAASPGLPKEPTQVLDLRGYTVIPGIVGMHDHLFYPTGNGMFMEMPLSFPRLYLANGVTTIRTTGSIFPDADRELKKLIDGDKIPGPKMHLSGPYLNKLKDPSEATRAVDQWWGKGAEQFKAYTSISPAELSAAIEAAHRHGAKVTGHLCSVGFRQAAGAGIDDLEHGLIVDTEFFPRKLPGKCPSPEYDPAFMSTLDVNAGPVHDMIVDLVQHHVAITSTLPVFEMFVPGRPALQQRVLDALTPGARKALTTQKETMVASLEQGSNGYKWSPWRDALKKEMEFEYAFVKAGGLLLAGPDPTGIGGVLAGFGDQREVELLVEAGFTPIEAIHIATANGAQFLGEAERIGTIRPGKQADLVIIRGDPSMKIEDIENVEIVFKDGIGYDSAALIASVRGIAGSR